MRPVNLIPAEERRGDRAPARTGRAPYLVIGGLVVAVVAVTALVVTSNQVKDREAEISSLEAREAAAKQRADALRPYAEFAAMAQARDATVTSLAQSRFDWERVLRELALVMPEDVWLSEASGTVSPDVQLESAVEITQRESVTGPALALIGCGADQEAVARFVAALEDIDGVTRVGLASSERPEPESGSESSGSSEGTDCRTRDFIARYEIILAFDAAPVSDAVASPSAAPTAPTATTAAAEGSSPTSGEASTGTSEAASGVADAQAEEQAVRDSTKEQTDKAGDAANLVPGVAR